MTTITDRAWEARTDPGKFGRSVSKPPRTMAVRKSATRERAKAVLVGACAVALVIPWVWGFVDLVQFVSRWLR